jgi:hypothetical protein
MTIRPLDWLVDVWLRHCRHDPSHVAADILEGSAIVEVKYCRRCGAVRPSYSREWRRPRPLWFAAAVVLCTLAGCAGTTQPADPKVVAEIVQACTGSGLFVAVNSLATSAVPVPGLAIAGQLLDAGITQVCANPEMYAADVSTIEWLIKNLSALKQKAAMRGGVMR